MSDTKKLRLRVYFTHKRHQGEELQRLLSHLGLESRWDNLCHTAMPVQSRAIEAAGEAAYYVEGHPDSYFEVRVSLRDLRPGDLQIVPGFEYLKLKWHDDITDERIVELFLRGQRDSLA